MTTIMSTVCKHCTILFDTWRIRAQHTAHYLYQTLLKPRSVDEDDRRREQILTLIVFGIVVLSVIFQITIIVEWLRTPTTFVGISPYIHAGFLVFYLSLFVACRRGYYKPAGYIFLTAFFSFTAYASYTWGASLPMALLSYALLISMASIIISSRFGLVMAILVCTSITISGYHEHINQINPEWKKGVIEIHDIVEYSIMLLVGTFLSWLYTREIEKSLIRARTSETALREERDNLELLVEARTKALRQAESARIDQLYRFAEFGKLSAGIFHDLLNPLTAVSLSVAKLSGNTTTDQSRELQQSITTAIDATKRMDQFMTVVKKQIKSDELRSRFSVNDAIRDVIDLLDYQIKSAGITITFDTTQEYILENNPFKFNQIVTNLLRNAIESYTDLSPQSKNILITIATTNNLLELRVTDNGSGIPSTIADKVFNPFFTTKQAGIGLGLSTIKDSIEQNFHGTITHSNNPDAGTTFVIAIPYNEPNPTSPNQNSS